jgi:hypothetical protein
MGLAYKVCRGETAWEVIEAVQAVLETLPKEGPGHTWYKWGKRVLDYMKGETDKNPFQIIKADGNKKVPFFCWSVLPVYMCPGKGDCAKWCYSLGSWRHAAAYWRQVQNTFLIRFYPERVVDAFYAMPDGADFRLYVDGDFHDDWAVDFWFKLLRSRPDIKCYGYSKSWDELFRYPGKYPDNYLLNVSNGGRERFVTLAELMTLPIVRGKFIAVDIPESVTKGLTMEEKFASKAYHDAVRQAGRDLGLKKTLSCKGFCGSCVKDEDGNNSHACGDRRFVGINILIGKH